MAVSQAFTSAGTTLAVSATLPATNNSAGFAALTYTPVGEVVDLGSYGKKYNLVSHNPVDSRKTVKRKGSYNSGTLSLKMARVPTDGGQVLLIAARDSDAAVSVKITLQNGTINYFQGMVMSYTTTLSTVDTIVSAQVDLEVTEDIVEI